jgi:hypothetical protein
MLAYISSVAMSRWGGQKSSTKAGMSFRISLLPISEIGLDLIENNSRAKSTRKTGSAYPYDVYDKKRVSRKSRQNAPLFST